jgi:hypothetical protein
MGGTRGTHGTNFLHKITQLGASWFFVVYFDDDKIMTDKMGGTRGMHGEN